MGPNRTPNSNSSNNTPPTPRRSTREGRGQRTTANSQPPQTPTRTALQRNRSRRARGASLLGQSSTAQRASAPARRGGRVRNDQLVDQTSECRICGAQRMSPRDGMEYVRWLEWRICTTCHARFGTKSRFQKTGDESRWDQKVMDRWNELVERDAEDEDEDDEDEDEMDLDQSADNPSSEFTIPPLFGVPEPGPVPPQLSYRPTNLQARLPSPERLGGRTRRGPFLSNRAMMRQANVRSEPALRDALASHNQVDDADLSFEEQAISMNMNPQVTAEERDDAAVRQNLLADWTVEDMLDVAMLDRDQGPSSSPTTTKSIYEGGMDIHR